MKILTFGCFNIIHVGHFDLFYLSKQIDPNGELIVAIAADKVVRNAKGKGAPVYSLRERMTMISGCRWVDGIDIYGEEIDDTELEACKNYEEHLALVRPSEKACVDLHRPDIITFGDDKDASTYNHFPNVRKIQLPRLRDFISSTKLISRLREEVC